MLGRERIYFLGRGCHFVYSVGQLIFKCLEEGGFIFEERLPFCSVG
jgi:hypothetical protein